MASVLTLIDSTPGRGYRRTSEAASKHAVYASVSLSELHSH